MIFGLSHSQKREKFNAQYRPWHRWFAWYPVWLEDGRLVWLQWVDRRASHDATYYVVGLGVSFEYRECFTLPQT
ncbi:hypothetical protein M2322_002665 [Rhodoblastus acidophilus]|uniref:hypothetical protein n=1 Tax=Rhodoblastus acidophilus TaxID=1074 RepID=UPI002224FA9D|nr:hypothetical protein [Rhodoblastus acidophilus]MCW2317111.1 hypothetical protein [Rhodoblastus acidophilus]